MDWFKIGKGVHQGCILLPCLFNLYVEYIMQYARLGEAHAGIKMAGKIINNLRYANDTILVAEIAEELKNLLMKVKEESDKAELKLNIQKTKMMASGTITSWPILGGKMETVTGFIFLGSKVTADSDCSHEIKRCLLLGRKAMTKLDSILINRHYFADKASSYQSYGFTCSHVYGCESWTIKKLSTKEMMLLNCCVGEDS